MNNRYLFLLGLSLLIGGLNAEAAQNGQGQPAAEVEQHHNIADLAQGIQPLIAQMDPQAALILAFMQEHPEILPQELLQPLPLEQNQVQQLLNHQAAEEILLNAVAQVLHQHQQHELIAQQQEGLFLQEENHENNDVPQQQQAPLQQGQGLAQPQQQQPDQQQIQQQQPAAQHQQVPQNGPQQHGQADPQQGQQQQGQGGQPHQEQQEGQGDAHQQHPAH